MRIGIFDSGIGGLNVLKQLLETAPNHHYIYFGDTANLPYGEKEKETLLQLGKQSIEFLVQKRVNMIIIACGTESTFVSELQAFSPVPLLDIFTPTIKKLVHHNFRKVGLIATEATIKNGYLEQQLRTYNIDVMAVACPKFVPMIEQGQLNQIDVSAYLSSYIGSGIESLILGCTHYPLLIDPIQKLLPDIPCMDMGKCLSENFCLESNDRQVIELYFSKVDPILKQNVKQIIPTYDSLNEVRK